MRKARTNLPTVLSLPSVRFHQQQARICLQAALFRVVIYMGGPTEERFELRWTQMKVYFPQARTKKSTPVEMLRVKQGQFPCLKIAHSKQ